MNYLQTATEELLNKFICEFLIIKIKQNKHEVLWFIDKKNLNCFKRLSYFKYHNIKNLFE